jgi:membrane-bound lytic murein transglycosylase F
MGYQYELLQSLSKKLDVDLEIIISNDLDNAFKKLNAFECDILAINLTVTQERKKQLTFTDAIANTRQVLVQKKPLNWEKMPWYTIDKLLIRNQLDLAGKTLHVMKNSAYVDRLQNLSDEIGDSIHIVEVEDYDVEQLISLVDNGEIEYTIADEEVALLNQTYYPAIDVQTAVSFPQKQAWALNGANTELLSEVNSWIGSIAGTDLKAVIYNKYFRDKKALQRSESEYISLRDRAVLQGEGHALPARVRAAGRGDPGHARGPDDHARRIRHDVAQTGARAGDRAGGWVSDRGDDGEQNRNRQETDQAVEVLDGRIPAAPRPAA